MIDIGQYGGNNDSGVLSRSEIRKSFENGFLNLPESAPLEGCSYNLLPYFTGVIKLYMEFPKDPSWDHSYLIYFQEICFLLLRMFISQAMLIITQFMTLQYYRRVYTIITKFIQKTFAMVMG